MFDLNTAASTQKTGKTLLEAGNRTLTYGDQWSRIHSLRTWIEDQGKNSETPVLVAVSDELEQASLLLALILLGKPPLIIDPGSTAVEATTLLANSDFDAVIAEPTIYERWGLDQLALPYLKVTAASARKGVFGALLGKHKQAEAESGWPGQLEPNTTPLKLEATPGSLAYILFTSGTTSTPKGVELSRAALAEQMAVLNRQYGLDSACRILNTLPLHHVDGLLQGPLLAWSSGGTVCRPLAFSTQKLQQYMDSVYRDRITHLIAVPTMLSLMLRFGQDWSDTFADDGFRMVVSCAGHLEHHIWEQLESVFGVTVVNMYGLTETGTSALFSGPNEDTRRVGTIGKPVNSRIRIVDEQSNEVAPGESGELLISTPQLMCGYHNEPTATRETIRNGWLYSGDLVRMLESGHVEIAGRKKNQIISGGRNISPEEVAACLNQHPGVIESVVFGLADADWGEQVFALVVSGQNGLDEADLTEWCRSRLSEYKVPKHILLVKEIEKGPSGKIRLEEARRRFEESRQGSVASSDAANNVETRVLQLAADTFRLHTGELNRDSSIENTAGWDSLGHLSLLLAAEQAFGVRFSAREIMQIDSIRKLVELCDGKAQS